MKKLILASILTFVSLMADCAPYINLSQEKLSKDIASDLFSNQVNTTVENSRFQYSNNAIRLEQCSDLWHVTHDAENSLSYRESLLRLSYSSLDTRDKQIYTKALRAKQKSFTALSNHSLFPGFKEKGSLVFLGSEQVRNGNEVFIEEIRFNFQTKKLSSESKSIDRSVYEASYCQNKDKQNWASSYYTNINDELNLEIECVIPLRILEKTPLQTIEKSNGNFEHFNNNSNGTYLLNKNITAYDEYGQSKVFHKGEALRVIKSDGLMVYTVSHGSSEEYYFNKSILFTDADKTRHE